jgi:hypothetical protein
MFNPSTSSPIGNFPALKRNTTKPQIPMELCTLVKDIENGERHWETMLSQM